MQRSSVVFSGIVAASVLTGCQTASETFVDYRMVEGRPVSSYSSLDVCMGAMAAGGLLGNLLGKPSYTHYQKVMSREASRRGLSERDCNGLILAERLKREKRNSWATYCYNPETNSSYPSTNQFCEAGYINVSKDQYEDLRP